VSDYLVRWKFGPNSLLNHSDVETWWYQQFHSTKEKAVEHYTSLLFHSSPSMSLTVEIFQLVQLVPGQPEPEDIPGGVPEEPIEESRNDRIVRLYNDGKTRREIATEMGLSYQTVYAITRPSSQK